MTDDEYSNLDAILMENIEDCLSIDEAHGFLTAMSVSQISLSNDECIESICGDSDFDDQSRKAVSDLILKMHSEIQSMLTSSDPFDILIIETEQDDEIIEVFEGWCQGFMLAVAQEHNLWDSLEKTEQTILSPIAKVALLISDESLEMEDDEYDMLVELLPGAVMGLHSYFKNKSVNQISL
ncbi:MAG: YecA family protein [Thiohalomonadales bacterium]